MTLFNVLCLSSVVLLCNITTTSALYDCGPSKIQLTSTTNTYNLSSPGNNGQETYPPNANCTWTIKAPSHDKHVELTFTTFDTHGNPTCGASTDDVLEIYDPGNEFFMIGKYCGNYLPAKVVSTGNVLTLVFKSTNRSSVSKKGFQLQYKAIDKSVVYRYECSPLKSEFHNKHINFQVDFDVIIPLRSPYYPNKYPSRIECIWKFKAEFSWDKLQLRFESVNIFNYKAPSSCDGSSSDVDSLVVYDGHDPLGTKPLISYCSSSSSPAKFNSSGRYMTIRFKSNLDNYFNGTTAGFQADLAPIHGVRPKDELPQSSSSVRVILGSSFGVICIVVLIIFCLCIAKRRGPRPGPSVTTMQTATTSAQQYPVQSQAGYQHPGQGSYSPPVQGSYPSTSQASPYPTSSDPPPPYPGPPTYPPQDNPAYNPQGGPQHPPYPPADKCSSICS